MNKTFEIAKLGNKAYHVGVVKELLAKDPIVTQFNENMLADLAPEEPEENDDDNNNQNQ